MWPMLSGANDTSPRTELPLSHWTLTVLGGWKIMTGVQRYNTHTPRVGWPADYNCTDRNHSKPLNCTDGCLWNVEDDPNEVNELSAAQPQRKAQLLARLKEVQAGVWHNCDPPSHCEKCDACAVASSHWGQVYGPCLTR